MHTSLASHTPAGHCCLSQLWMEQAKHKGQNKTRHLQLTALMCHSTTLCASAVTGRKDLDEEPSTCSITPSKAAFLLSPYSSKRSQEDSRTRTSLYRRLQPKLAQLRTFPSLHTSLGSSSTATQCSDVSQG